MLLKYIIVIIRNNTIVFLRTDGTPIYYLDPIIPKLSWCSHSSNYTANEIKQQKPYRVIHLT